MEPEGQEISETQASDSEPQVSYHFGECLDSIPATFMEVAMNDDLESLDDEVYFRPDPACSALSRDAARFMETQSSLGQRLYFPSLDHERNKLASQAVLASSVRDFAATSHAQEDCQAADGDVVIDSPVMQKLPDGGSGIELAGERSTSKATTPIDTEVVDLTSDETTAFDNEPSTPSQEQPSSPPLDVHHPTVDVRCSPPVISASQASTVTDTQCAPTQRQPLTPRQTVVFQPPSAVSDHSMLPLLPDLQSSSPLPQPPFSPDARTVIPSSSDSGFLGLGYEEEVGTAERRTQRKVRPLDEKMTAKEILPDSLLDFSLPAPPESSWRWRSD